jgi:hypothetical protein
LFVLVWILIRAVEVLTATRLQRRASHLADPSGVDVNDFGFIMKDCSVERIKDSVRVIVDLFVQELKERARKAWQFARANHTREKFAKEYRKAVVDIITSHRSRPIPRAAA